MPAHEKTGLPLPTTADAPTPARRGHGCPSKRVRAAVLLAGLSLLCMLFLSGGVWKSCHGAMAGHSHQSPDQSPEQSLDQSLDQGLDQTQAEAAPVVVAVVPVKEIVVLPHEVAETAAEDVDAAEMPDIVTSPSAFARLLEAVSPESLHALLHAYLPETYKHGVYPSEKSALEALHRANAPLAASIVQLARRDGNGTTAAPTSTPAPSSKPVTVSDATTDADAATTASTEPATTAKPTTAKQTTASAETLETAASAASTSSTYTSTFTSTVNGTPTIVTATSVVAVAAATTAAGTSTAPAGTLQTDSAAAGSPVGSLRLAGAAGMLAGLLLV